MRRPSQPFLGHTASTSTSSLSHEVHHAGASSYAPSVYAQSTLAASTIMPGMAVQPVRNSLSVQWQEGHCMHWRPNEFKATCSVCEEKSDDGLYRCTGKFSHTTSSIAPDLTSHPQAAAHTHTVDVSALSPSCVLWLFDPIKYVRHSFGALLAFCIRTDVTWFLRLGIERRLVWCISSRWRNL